MRCELLSGACRSPQRLSPNVWGHSKNPRSLLKINSFVTPPRHYTTHMITLLVAVQSFFRYWFSYTLGDGAGGGTNDLGGSTTIVLTEQKNLWLYWGDTSNEDNIGGTTIGVRRISETDPILETATMLLLGTGIAGLPVCFM